MNAHHNNPSADHIVNKSSSGIIFGRFMLPDMTEHACQVLDITGDSAIFVSSTAPAAGIHIVAYLEELGRVEVVADAPVAGGFKVKFSATGSRLERLQQRIQWLKQKDDGAVESRRHPRFEPKDKNSSITLPDGRVYACEVIDISVSGAAIRTAVLPSLGTYIMLGKMKGRIVRYVDGGVAIEFAKQMDKSTFEQQVA
ncbi:MAG: PilZ domain-containing protein [Hyphomicrobiales bacterium]